MGIGDARYLDQFSIPQSHGSLGEDVELYVGVDDVDGMVCLGVALDAERGYTLYIKPADAERIMMTWSRALLEARAIAARR